MRGSQIFDVCLKVMEQYACCSRDGKLPACGQKYDSIGMAYLDIDHDGFYKCSTCDFGIVAPDDELSRSEPDGSVRIRKARFRREAAMLAKENLTKALQPLDALIAELEGVDPPDFGSFTDWMQRRQELLQSGQATGVPPCRPWIHLSLDCTTSSQHRDACIPPLWLAF
jgi:hypothetical protein